MTFLEVLLVTVCQTIGARAKHGDEEALLKEVFSKAKEVPEMVPGLQFFLSSNVKGSSLVGGGEKKALKRQCRSAVSSMALLDAASFES